MQNSGSLLVRTFVSRAQLPVQGATVIVYADDPGGLHHLLAMRTTNESGVAGPIELAGGNSMGLQPDGPIPFTNYQLIVEHPDYQVALFRNLQIFPGVDTIQDVALIPLSVSELPDFNATTVTPQPL